MKVWIFMKIYSNNLFDNLLIFNIIITLLLIIKIMSNQDQKQQVMNFITNHLGYSVYEKRELCNKMCEVLQNDEVRKEYKSMLSNMWETYLDWLDIAPTDGECLNEYLEGLAEEYCDKYYLSDESNAGEVRNYDFIIDGKIRTLSVDTY